MRVLTMRFSHPRGPSGRSSERNDGGAVATFAPTARAPRLDEWMSRGVISHRVAKCAGTHAVNHDGLVQAGERSIVQVAIEHFQRLLDCRAAQIQRRGDGSRSFELET